VHPHYIDPEYANALYTLREKSIFFCKLHFVMKTAHKNKKRTESTTKTHVKTQNYNYNKCESWTLNNTLIKRIDAFGHLFATIYVLN